MDEIQEIKTQVRELIQEVDVLKQKTRGIQTNAFLNQISVDPQSSSFLKDFIAIPYTTTIPTYIPNKDGYQVLVKTGGNYYAYFFVDTAWRRVQIT